MRTRKDPSRYRLAGLAADELINILRGAAEDRALWAYYCYHHDIPTLLEKAHTLAARERRGLIANALTAFQSWLTRTFGREAT